MNEISWTPDLKATAIKPSLGGIGAVQAGQFLVDADGWARGFGILRMGSGATRGSGIYRLPLPAEASEAVYGGDPQNSEPIGTCTIGFGLEHRVGKIHLCGLTGYVSRQHAVMVISGGLFVSHSFPNAGGDIDNIHYEFFYPVQQA